jgi:myo-inositol-1(or 4)-monophosphatase
MNPNEICQTIRAAERGRVLAGAICNPYLGEMFHAVRGGGAFLNGRPIRVSDEPLSGSVVCFGSAPYRPDLSARSFSLARLLFDNSLDVRREGAAALDLCSVAAGRAGLYFELDLSLWDYAAGALLVEEAGGVCRTAEGGPLPFTGEKSNVVAAASPAVMEEVLRLTEGVL